MNLLPVRGTLPGIRLIDDTARSLSLMVRGLLPVFTFAPAVLARDWSRSQGGSASFAANEWIWTPIGLPAWLFIAVLGLALLALIVSTLRKSRLSRLLEKDNKALRARSSHLEETVAFLRESAEIREEDSRKIGSVSIISDILYGIGNVLNGVHVSANIAEERIQDLRLDFLEKLTALIGEREVGKKGTQNADSKGELLLPALTRWKNRLEKNQAQAVAELKQLHERVFQINEIVAAQKKYLFTDQKIAGVDVRQLVDDVLLIQTALIEELRIQIVKDFQAIPKITCVPVKLLHIVNHIIKNACEALMVGANLENRILVIRLRTDNKNLRLEIEDNGNGIGKESMTEIFSPGFSTKSAGHGSSLHYCANTIAEMGGMIGVKSKGAGTGATFILEIPINPHALSEEPGVGTRPELTEAMPE